jgi:hypothetical protein
MSATLSDGTSVTNLAEDPGHSGNVSKWSIATAAGATVVSASATRPETGGNPQFVVSHCTAGGTPPTTTTTTTTTTPRHRSGGGVTPTQPQAAVAVVSVPVFTG